MELPLSQLSAALAVRARRTVSSHHRRRLVSRALQQRRRDQQSPQFKKRMRQRNAIEGTISELARARGLRCSRSVARREWGGPDRGFAKVELQNLFIDTACNIKRWLRRPKLTLISTSYSSTTSSKESKLFVGYPGWLSRFSYPYSRSKLSSSSLTAVTSVLQQNQDSRFERGRLNLFSNSICFQSS